jgi:hypothetical protein
LIQHDKIVYTLFESKKVNKFSESVYTFRALCDFNWLLSIEGQNYWSNITDQYKNSYYAITLLENTYK